MKKRKKKKITVKNKSRFLFVLLLFTIFLTAAGVTMVRGKSTSGKTAINTNKTVDYVDLKTQKSMQNTDKTDKPQDNNTTKPETQTNTTQTTPTETKAPDTKKPDTVTPNGNKVVYLTFDDGPSTNVTPLVLDALKKENVHATFFVVGTMAKSNPSLLKREVNEGNAVGNHTYSHNYNNVYSSSAAFLSEYKKADDVITSIIGDHNKSLIRFPGGSFNKPTYKQVAQSAGYNYVDWNCLTGDAEVPLASVDRLVSRFKQTYHGQDQLIILMHDAPAKTTTPQALPQIIQFLKSQGYTFKTL